MGDDAVIRDYAHAASLQERHEASGWAAQEAEEQAHQDLFLVAKEYAALMSVARAVLPKVDADGLRETLAEYGSLYGIAEDHVATGMEPHELIYPLLDTPMQLDAALEILRRAGAQQVAA